MWKSITITFGSLLIWGYVGGFDWVFDSLDCWTALNEQSLQLSNAVVVSDVIDIKIFTENEVRYLVWEALYANKLQQLTHGSFLDLNIDVAIYEKNFDLIERIKKEIIPIYQAALIK